MNFQNLNFDFAERHRPYPPQFWSPRTPSDQSQSTVRPSDGPRRNDDIDNDSSIQPSLSSHRTVIPYAPSPPLQSGSIQGHYNPDQLFGPPLVPNYHASQPTAPNPVVRFNEAQIAMDEVANAARARGFKDELTLAAGMVTPGVDDTPYIQYALDALTRESAPSPTIDLSYPSGYDDGYRISHITHDPEQGFLPHLAPLPSVHAHESFRQRSLSPQPWHEDLGRGRPHPLPAFQNRTPSVLSSIDPERFKTAAVPKGFQRGDWHSISESERMTNGKTKLDSLDPGRKKYPRLTFVPHILRLPSMILFMTLCILMITALMFSAIYSKRDGVMLAYGNSINTGKYFLFRIFPQMLAAVIFIYAQCIMTTTIRILPFAAMAHDEAKPRRDALFQNLYPRTFLLPQLAGPAITKVCLGIIWLSALTIPLISAGFTVKWINEQWHWTSVQGVTWTLVTIYFLLLGSIISLAIYWHNRVTGLMWDARSIADIAHIINTSHTIQDYAGTEGLPDRANIRSVLRNRLIDRLGYWHDTVRVWYGIGAAHDQVNLPSHVIAEKEHIRRGRLESVSSGALTVHHEPSRRQYLPWCMRSNQLLYLVVGGAVLLLALLVISFVPQTRVTDGFRPRLSAAPDAGSFSAANFVYSFIPSLLGMIMYLLFQSLDLSVRILQPWAELSRREGSLATTSILVDYAACLPLEAVYRAYKNRHWKVALVSLLSTLVIFIPILAGGLFMALTDTGTWEVRMFPSLPVFGVLLALLFIYLGGLLALFPGRRLYRLPHAVTCLAEIISFLANNDLIQDEAFRAVVSRRNMLGRLGVGQLDLRDQTKWYLGVPPGREGEERFGVRRMKQFTERKARRSVI